MSFDQYLNPSNEPAAVHAKDVVTPLTNLRVQETAVYIGTSRNEVEEKKLTLKQLNRLVNLAQELVSASRVVVRAPLAPSTSEHCVQLPPEHVSSRQTAALSEFEPGLKVNHSRFLPAKNVKRGKRLYRVRPMEILQPSFPELKTDRDSTILVIDKQPGPVLNPVPIYNSPPKAKPPQQLAARSATVVIDLPVIKLARSLQGAAMFVQGSYNSQHPFKAQPGAGFQEPPTIETELSAASDPRR